MFFALQKVEGLYGGRTMFSPMAGAIINRPPATDLSSLYTRKLSCDGLRGYHVCDEFHFLADF